MKVVGYLVGEPAGQTRHEKARLCGQFTRGHRHAFRIALNNAADVHLPRAGAVAYRVAEGRVEVPLLRQLVIQPRDCEVLVSDHGHRKVVSEPVQSISLIQVIAVGLETPDLGDDRAQAEP